MGEVEDQFKQFIEAENQRYRDQALWVTELPASEGNPALPGNPALHDGPELMLPLMKHVPQYTKQDKADPQFIKELLKRLSEAGFVYSESAQNWERIYKGHFENPKKESTWHEKESCIDWRGTWFEAKLFCELFGASRLINSTLLWEKQDGWILWFELRCLFKHKKKTNDKISDGYRGGSKTTKRHRGKLLENIMTDLTSKHHGNTSNLRKVYDHNLGQLNF